MTKTPKKPSSDHARPNELADDAPPFRASTDEDWAEFDAWGERNKDALAESIRRADAQFARGEYYTLDEVMAHLTEQRLKRMRKD